MTTSHAFRSRAPAVAGMFYPGDPDALRVAVRSYLDHAPRSTGRAPKALIVPHAGYAYSGPIAASAYATLAGASGTIRRVVLAGPTPRVAVVGIAIPSSIGFDTPLGRIPLDAAMLDRLAQLPGVGVSDQAHRLEHSLEVQLPFLQMTLDSFELVPLAVGMASAELVAKVLETAWGGPETLIVVSTDLSHYHPYEEARRIDGATSAQLALLAGNITGEQACGCHALNGLLLAAARRGMTERTLDVRNSGDTSGDRAAVVGYGAFALHEPE